ncbi:phenylalanine--tRNA ligase subunit alpha [Halobaculum sp. MBLA0143]|uniref:phenylalanine--tRNA ligase subunit alpha n=1 Tax=Halobaculum sp. MBLA0143 TaxID=3079933 RepID=UPI003523AE1A
MKLPEKQVELLNTVSANDWQSVEDLAEETGFDGQSITQAAFELRDHGLVEINERRVQHVSITDEGRQYVEDGLPEIRLYRAVARLSDGEPVEMGRAIGEADLGGPEVDIALANYSRKGCGEIEDGQITAAAEYDPDDMGRETERLAELAEKPVTRVEPEKIDNVYDRLESRGLAEVDSSTTREIRLTDDGVDALMTGVEAAETVDRLTPELLTSGEWEDVEFTEYDVEADAPETQGGRRHVLRSYADRVKDVLVGMGFQEMDGPHADADFWINDCLFMPQDHPARTHWDRFALDVGPAEEIPQELIDRVGSAHRDGVGEDGDGYHSPWSESFARSVALRGHTTSLSMRYLSGVAGEDVDPPQRYFSVEKVYRNDTLDATHLLEFFQIEGWVLADELSVRDLMGTFEEFYRQFGITDVQFKPHYNPYTEPSFELFGEHPETGELIEIGNSGIFREEVLSPLGVDGDVMAWGLALERLAMLATGAEDIRDLHGTLADLEFLRNAEVPY